MSFPSFVVTLVLMLLDDFPFMMIAV